MINQEIEYKILIDKIPDCVLKDDEPHYIEQFYFDSKNVSKIINQLLNLERSGEGYVNRVRMTKYQNMTKYVLCVKSQTGFIHSEDECEITKEQYEIFKAEANDSGIIKNRYVDSYLSHQFEFDEFLNLGTKHLTVEVEIQDNFISIEDVMRILREHYDLINIKDVTNDSNYLNVNLINFFKNKKIKF